MCAVDTGTQGAQDHNCIEWPAIRQVLVAKKEMPFGCQHYARIQVNLHCGTKLKRTKTPTDIMKDFFDQSF